jgi:hypothetical protein
MIWLRAYLFGASFATLSNNMPIAMVLVMFAVNKTSAERWRA